LIGYQSSNIYKIWNPVTNQVIRSRDVVFNEDEVFQGDLERLKDQLRKTSLEEIRKTLQEAMTEIPRDRFEEEEGARPAEEWVTSLPAGSNEEDLNPLAGEPLFLQEAARQDLELEER